MRVQFRDSFDATEKPIAVAIGAEEHRKWPKLRRRRRSSSIAAPNGNSGLKCLGENTSAIAHHVASK